MYGAPEWLLFPHPATTTKEYMEAVEIRLFQAVLCKEPSKVLVVEFVAKAGHIAELVIGYFNAPRPHKSLFVGHFDKIHKPFQLLALAHFKKWREIPVDFRRKVQAGTTGLLDCGILLFVNDDV